MATARINIAQQVVNRTSLSDIFNETTGYKTWRCFKVC